MKQFGICMEGTEEAIEKLVGTWGSGRSQINYLEIGVCYGTTLAAMTSILTGLSGCQWQVVGVDKEPAFTQCVREALARIGLELVVLDDPSLPPSLINPTLYAMEASRYLTARTDPIHLAFIDGCHSMTCVEADFLGVERLAVPGTLVLFHDFGPESQGGCIQPHCNAPIGVRAAAGKLGLLDETRPSWKAHPVLRGDKVRNGADIGVFERV
jgi:hypothetical protein